MPNPWDRPPRPARGDIDENATYAGVGRVISRWELLETETADLYAIFLAARYCQDAYDEYYKRGKTTQNRIATTGEAADRYFRRTPNQTLEGSFCGLMRKLRGFSERRHEVAHGIVRPMHWYAQSLPTFDPDYGGQYQYCVVPPPYQRTWVKGWTPEYVYTSLELIALSDLIFSVFNEFGQFKNLLLGVT